MCIDLGIFRLRLGRAPTAVRLAINITGLTGAVLDLNLRPLHVAFRDVVVLQGTDLHAGVNYAALHLKFQLEIAVGFVGAEKRIRAL